MRGNRAGSIICFLAFLSVIRTQDVVKSPDLVKAYLQSISNNEDSSSDLLAKALRNDVEDELSDDAAGQTNIRRNGAPSDDFSGANANDDSDLQYALDEERSGFSASHAQAHAEASSGGGNRYPGYNPYYPGSLSPPSPHSAGSSSALAQAQAISGSLGGQELNPYSPGSLYPASPYGTGSSSASAQAQAISGSGSLGGQELNPYSPGSLYPASPYDSRSNSALAQALAEASSVGEGPRGKGLNPGISPYSPGAGGYLSPYSSGSSSAQAQAEASSGGNLNGLSPYSPGSLYPSLPYGSGSSSASAQALAEALNGARDQGMQELNPGLNPNLPGSLNPLSPPGSGSSSAQAQAQAEAISGGGSPGGPEANPYSPGSLYPSLPGSGPNSAHAQAEAISEEGFNGQRLSPGLNPYSPESLYLGSPFDSGSSSASAQALAEVSNGGNPRGQGVNPGLNPYLPGSPYPVSPSSAGSSSAQAQAEAISGRSPNGQDLNPELNPYSPGYPYPELPYDSGSSSASAQAQAEASFEGEGFPYSPGSLYPDSFSGSGSSSAQALAEASSGLQPLSPIRLGYPLVPGSESNAHANANAEATSVGQAHAEAIARAFSTGNLNYRPIPQHEYILPYNVPGAENVVVCTRVGELHYIWTNVECFVCACVMNYGSKALSPVCASCSGCLDPEPVTLPPPRPPSPPPPPPVPTPPPTPSPPPPPQVSCSPLPSRVPFQNPLHPCQICICTESVTVYGQPDVQIECQENPQCVLPPDVTTLPPVPDDRPRPLPLCKKFPQNVFFPYPADPCKLCKCTVSLSDYGIPEEQISCYPNPVCNPQPFPFPTSTANPVTEPYIITTPHPVTTPAPPAPGPLPGPSPHESCRPYQPNQPFQHPWDECQLCICTESYSVGLITIEVNCYNKKSCCLDVDPVTSSPLPYGGLIGSAESHASAIAQSNSNLLQSGNLLPSNVSPQDVLPQNQALAEAIAIAQNNQPEYVLGPQGNQIRPGGFVPESVLVPLGHHHRPGENHLDDILGLQGHRPVVGQSSAEAIASAQSQVTGGAGDQPEYIVGPQGHHHRPGDSHPENGLVPQSYQRPGVSQSLAEAIASAQPQVNPVLGVSQPTQLLGTYGSQIKPRGQVLPQNRPGLSQSDQYLVPGMSSAEAEALANSLAGYNTNQPSYYQGNTPLVYNPPSYYGNGYYNYPAYYTGYLGNRGIPGYAQGGSSSAEAVANANGVGSNANAEALALSQGLSQADASANAQSSLLSGKNYGYRPQDNVGYNSAGVPASLLYSDLYSRPSYEITPLYQPGRGSGGSFNTQAIAQAQAQGSSSAQAQASAVSGGRNKSGNPDDEADNEQGEERK